MNPNTAKLVSYSLSELNGLDQSAQYSVTFSQVKWDSSWFHPRFANRMEFFQ